MRSPARLFVVDDHPIVRLGIRQMVAADPGLSICCESGSAAAALQQIKQSAFDLAIVDLSLGDGSGLPLIRSLRENAPDTPVLVLSMHDETLFAERALKSGARGYIMKHEAIAGLVGAIQRVLSGGIYLSERMSQRLLTRFRPGRHDVFGLDLLTDRELEVFEAIGRGLSTAETAHRMGVSAKTVETHRANIKHKLHLDGASELLRYATSWLERI